MKNTTSFNRAKQKAKARMKKLNSESLNAVSFGKIEPSLRNNNIDLNTVLKEERKIKRSHGNVQKKNKSKCFKYAVQDKQTLRDSKRVQQEIGYNKGIDSGYGVDGVFISTQNTPVKEIKRPILTLNSKKEKQEHARISKEIRSQFKTDNDEVIEKITTNKPVKVYTVINEKDRHDWKKESLTELLIGKAY